MNKKTRSYNKVPKMGFILPQDLLDEVEKISKEEGITKTEIGKGALELYINLRKGQKRQQDLEWTEDCVQRKDNNNWFYICLVIIVFIQIISFIFIIM